MDTARAHLLRDVLAGTGWVERTRDFARSLRRPTAEPGTLLLVGTPSDEPWHLAAHLDDEARFSGVPQLSPTLVRWAPPAGAAPHLSIGLDRIARIRRGEAVFVVAPEPSPEHLLERVSDARRAGATVLSIDSGDDELGDLAHDRLVVPVSEAAEGGLVVARAPTPARVDIDLVQHLVSVAAGELAVRSSTRTRLARALERLSGPPPQQ